LGFWNCVLVFCPLFCLLLFIFWHASTSLFSICLLRLFVLVSTLDIYIAVYKILYLRSIEYLGKRIRRGKCKSDEQIKVVLGNRFINPKYNWNLKLIMSLFIEDFVEMISGDMWEFGKAKSTWYKFVSRVRTVLLKLMVFPIYKNNNLKREELLCAVRTQIR